MAGLSREVVKWTQSLDLAWQIKVPKWDLSNGYLIGEIFAWYFDREIQRNSFYHNCESLKRKEHNWHFVKKFIQAKELDIPKELIEGTIHCKEGAAILLLERLFEILTNRKLKKVPEDVKADFTDYPYQVKLPLHARSTASRAVKNNLRLSETLGNKNHLFLASKAMKIISDHVDHRRIERLEDPDRFDIKPTIGERCLRLPLPEKGTSDEQVDDNSHERISTQESDLVKLPGEGDTSSTFKEIQVVQQDKSGFYNMAIHGC